MQACSGGCEEEDEVGMNVEPPFRPIPTFAAGFSVLKLATTRACCRRCTSSYPYPPSLTYPTMLCRPSSRAASVNYNSPVLSRPRRPTANTAARRPFFAPPLQTLRSPRAVRPNPYLLPARENSSIDPRSRLRHHQHRHLQADQVRRQVHGHPYSRYATREKQGQFTARDTAKGSRSQVTVSVPRFRSRSRPFSRPTMSLSSGSRSTSPAWSTAASTPRSSSASPSPR